MLSESFVSKNMNNNPPRIAKYSVAQVTDSLVLIIDDDDINSPSVTNTAEAVIADLAGKYDLTNRKVYYRDSMGIFDELMHLDGQFLEFAPCSENQRVLFAKSLAA